MKTYARQLAARLPHAAPEFDYVTFTDGGNFGWDEQVRLPLAMRAARLDLVHFLSLYVPVVLPSRFIVTVHDLIHLHFPQQFKAKVGPYYRTVVRRACARAARVITDDERTIADLESLLGVSPAKIRVIPLGVEEAFFAPAVPYRGERPYLLYVGNHRTHKDLATLFAAWQALPESVTADLYLTGSDDFGDGIERRRTNGNLIVALGDCTTAQLAGYYAGARALIQPSLREGFGLPVLEAMAAGCPIVACEASVPLVLRDAAQTFPARDRLALRACLEKILLNEGARDEWVKLGREAARRWTWDRCARATAGVYREVLEL